ncbi:MAG: RNA polymerase sigma factor [Defluviitaleaceae bacterium]|nr:RNA polymerase sigma factor [Defluviitaleaceae bacterium]
MTDNAILDLFFARDESAIVETQKKYASYLLTVAKNILPSIQDAEECVSDTFFKTWQVIPPGRPTLFKSFLAKITRNRALDKHRANTAKKRAAEPDLIMSELAESIPSPSDVHADLESILTAREINKFLGELDNEARFIFMRRYWYADSISAIAKNLGASESKIKSSLSRTRQKLRVALSQ